MAIEKLTFAEVIKEIRVIHMWPGGVEYIADEWTQFQFESKRPYFNNGETKEEIKSYREMYSSANKNLAKWKKGLRILIKIAKKGPGAFERIGNAIHGNGAKSNIDYFWKLYRTISTDDIIKMGELNKTPQITSYVDGSYDYSF